MVKGLVRGSLRSHSTTTGYRPRSRKIVPVNKPLSLAPLRIAFFGKLGGATLSDARREVRLRGGKPVDPDAPEVDWMVLGEAELPLAASEAQLASWLLERADRGDVRILSETEFWREIGRIDALPERQLYTAAALAAMLDLPVAVIRRWHRTGLLHPVKTIHRLAYFDFAQAVTARQLARLLSAGVSPAALERKLKQLAQFLPSTSRSLDQLSLMVERGDILARSGRGWIDSRGQRRFDFDAPPDDDLPSSRAMPAADESDDAQVTPVGEEGEPPTVAAMVGRAERLEDQGELESAAQWYRSALAAGGPAAELCFRLGEVLYRMGELAAARERYYMALEQAPDFVEARANLGCVLAELGDDELACAAFEGALASHPDYADVHHHLAAALERLGQAETARRHWQRFLELSPRGPWADAVRRRLDRRP